MTVGFMNPAMAIITDLLFAQKGKVVDAEMILDIQFQMRKTSNLSPEMENNINESPVMRLTPEDLERGAALLLESGYVKSSSKARTTPDGKSAKDLLFSCIQALGPAVERRKLIEPMKQILIELGRSARNKNVDNALSNNLESLLKEGFITISYNGKYKIYTLTENNTNKDNDK